MTANIYDVKPLSDAVAEVAAEPKPGEPPPASPKAKQPAKRKFTGRRKAPRSKPAPKPAARVKAGAQPAAKPARGRARAEATDLPPAATIRWLAHGNPARAGSGRYERIAKLMRFNGKTVEAALKVVPRHTVANSLKRGLMKLT
jgi:hypothetical protein